MLSQRKSGKYWGWTHTCCECCNSLVFSARLGMGSTSFIGVSSVLRTTMSLAAVVSASWMIAELSQTGSVLALMHLLQYHNLWCTFRPLTPQLFEVLVQNLSIWSGNLVGHWTYCCCHHGGIQASPSLSSWHIPGFQAGMPRGFQGLQVVMGGQMLVLSEAYPGKW